jgi:hypothetical protein
MWPFSGKDAPPPEPQKPKLKICCACPDTKVPRAAGLVADGAACPLRMEVDAGPSTEPPTQQPRLRLPLQKLRDECIMTNGGFLRE